MVQHMHAFLAKSEQGAAAIAHYVVCTYSDRVNQSKYQISRCVPLGVSACGVMVGRTVRRLSDCCRTLRALVCHPDCQTAVGHCRYTVGHCRTPSDTAGHCQTLPDTVGLLDC